MTHKNDATKVKLQKYQVSLSQKRCVTWHLSILLLRSQELQKTRGRLHSHFNEDTPDCVTVKQSMLDRQTVPITVLAKPDHAFVSDETTLPSSDLVGLILEFAQQTIRLHKFQSPSFPGQMKWEP